VKTHLKFTLNTKKESYSTLFLFGNGHKVLIFSIYEKIS